MPHVATSSNTNATAESIQESATYQSDNANLYSQQKSMQLCLPYDCDVLARASLVMGCCGLCLITPAFFNLHVKVITLGADFSSVVILRHFLVQHNS